MTGCKSAAFIQTLSENLARDFFKCPFLASLRASRRNLRALALLTAKYLVLKRARDFPNLGEKGM